MMRTLLFIVLALSISQVTYADAPSIPPANEGALEALKKSPRHGEFVDIAMPNSEAKLKAFVVYPEKKEKAPVVLVIHEIFGLTDWVRSVADQLAADGFIAIAPDMLSGKGPNGGGTESFQGDAVRDAIRKLSVDEITQRLDAARAYGIALPSATPKFATIGFCWGGMASFAYATRQPELSGAIVYYGNAPADDALQQIKAPVLGLYGEDDARITSTVKPTEEKMRAAGKTFDAHVYEKAGHGFLRQQSGKEGANQKASQSAWKETISFLRARLSAQ